MTKKRSLDAPNAPPTLNVMTDWRKRRDAPVQIPLSLPLHRPPPPRIEEDKKKKDDDGKDPFVVDFFI